MDLIDPTQFTSVRASWSQPPLVNFVVPCFNEEKVLRETAGRMGAILEALKSDGRIAPASAVYFVDDGSSDATWTIIAELAVAQPDCCGRICCRRTLVTTTA